MSDPFEVVDAFLGAQGITEPNVRADLVLKVKDYQTLRWSDTFTLSQSSMSTLQLDYVDLLKRAAIESKTTWRYLESLQMILETVVDRNIRGGVLEAGELWNANSIFATGVMQALGQFGSLLQDNVPRRQVWVVSPFKGNLSLDNASETKSSCMLGSSTGVEKVRARFQHFGLLSSKCSVCKNLQHAQHVAVSVPSIQSVFYIVLCKQIIFGS
jgi:hypothetical protein